MCLLQKLWRVCTLFNIRDIFVIFEMFSDIDPLDILLSKATEEIEAPQKKRKLDETNIFGKTSNNDSDVPDQGKSLVHSGHTDSSDDEGNKNYENAKYNEYGKEIKRILTDTTEQLQFSGNSFKNTRRTGWKSSEVTLTSGHLSKPRIALSNGAEKKKYDVYTDPVFGIRIINPLVSSSVLQERMTGRDAVSFAQLSRYLQIKNKDKDWVVSGVIVNKSNVRTSQKGNQFLIWTLSDLKGDIKTVSVFLFGSAYRELWKTVAGTVVGILNPNMFDKREGSKDLACLSVDNFQRVMIFGTSKDFGTCRSTKKNGEKCTAIVNTSNCEFCLYHIKQEYQKCSQRSELQSNFVGRGLTALRNKVLGKNEVFYAGKSYMAIPAKKSRKLEQKDTNRLQSLTNVGCTSFNNAKPAGKSKPRKKQNAARLEVSQAQRLRDLELLKKLGGSSGIENKNHFNGTHSSGVTLEDSKKTALDIIDKLKSNKCEPSKNVSQYNINSDLRIDIESKNVFCETASELVSLEKSKSTALDVIAKLKKKQTQMKKENKLVGEMEESRGNISLNNDENERQNHKTVAKINMSPGSSSEGSASGDHNEMNGLNREEAKSLVMGTNNKAKLVEGLADNYVLKHYNTDLSNECTIFDKILGGNKDASDIFSTALNSDNNTASFVSEKSHTFSSNFLSKGVPTLSNFGPDKMIDFSKSITTKRIAKAKMNAIKLIQQNGPLKRSDPNSTRGPTKKRNLQEIESPKMSSESAPKKSKLAESDFISDRFKKMMAATSKHTDLLEARDDEEQEKYFKKQEIKEKMEEKMSTTYKVPCKAVCCLKCKYKSFSASDLCKKEQHPLKVYDAMKRFFKCGNCGNRTCSLEIIPIVPCKNCGSGKWEKTGMMKEKIVTAAHSLSIRGGEQKFMNSVIGDTNINLLVPDTN